MNIFLVAYYRGDYSPAVRHLIPRYIQPPFRRRHLGLALLDHRGHSQVRPLGDDRPFVHFSR